MYTITNNYRMTLYYYIYRKKGCFLGNIMIYIYTYLWNTIILLDDSKWYTLNHSGNIGGRYRQGPLADGNDISHTEKLMGVKVPSLVPKIFTDRSQHEARSLTQGDSLANILYAWACFLMFFAHVIKILNAPEADRYIYIYLENPCFS